MATRSTDVCVVGAGLAGLAAARAVAAAGKSVVLLEARDRVGGRIWNKTLDDGLVLSVGGTWLGKDQHRMFELCHELGIETYPQYHEGAKLLRLGTETLRYSGIAPGIGIFALASLGLAFKKLERLSLTLPLDAPWQAPRARELDGITLGDWLDSRWNVPSAKARLLLETTFSLLFCADTHESSLLGTLLLARGGKGGFQYYTDSRLTETHLVSGGSPLVADRMAAALGDALVLSSPVQAIRRANGAMEVVSDRATVRASRVIVATPPLLAGRIDYEPALPRTHSQLFERALAGTMIRIVAVYPQPFWRDDGLCGESACAPSDLPVTIDQTPKSGSPGVLSAYAFGRGGAEMAKLSADERRRRIVAALVERFGAKAGSPLHIVETDWNAEAWSAGAMIAHYPPGAISEYGRALREPVDGIHWAASERATEMHGLMEGAVRSGERAAAEALAAI